MALGGIETARMKQCPAELAVCIRLVCRVAGALGQLQPQQGGLDGLVVATERAGRASLHGKRFGFLAEVTDGLKHWKRPRAQLIR